MKPIGIAAGLAIIAGLTTTPADAGLTLCNRTSFVLYAATAAVTMPEVTVKAWSRIVPGACTEALRGDLNAQQYYLYARTSRAHSGPLRAWSGAVNSCIKDKDFTQRLPFGARCPADFYQAGFAQVDTKRLQNWTTTLRDAPDLPSMAAAERAGLKRLLADNGFKPLGNDRDIDAALGAFKARVRMQKNANAASLFDALETAAMKATAPTGYTLCNDTGAPFYAAIGLQNGSTFAARGWWTVPGGSCSQLLSEPIGGKKIWLRVERGKAVTLVQGAAKFCVTNIEFDIQGRERCAARGLTEAGFAQTHGRAAPGYTAHVTATGLTAN